MLSKREKVLIAVLGSLLLHLFILLLFGIGLHFKPDVVAASNEPLKLEIKPPEEEPLPSLPPTMAMAPTPPPMVNNQKSDEPPPDNPAFQSNENSKASSELPATGSAPVPTQDGKQIPEFTFDTKNYTLGDRPAEDASASAQAQPPAQPPQPQDKPQPTPTPPPAKETPPPAKETPPPKPKKERTPKAEPTPVPTPEIKRELDEFAMLGPTPTPHPEPSFEDNQFDPTRREPMTEPPRPTPAVRRPPAARAPSRAAMPGYQPQTQKALLSGSLSNKGPASVAALGTPMGRYQKAVFDAVGSRWYYYIDQRMDVASFGRVKIHFTIDKTGAVLQPTVVSHSGNSTLESASLQAIMDATIPPMPPEVSAIIQSNQMDLEIEFNLLDM